MMQRLGHIVNQVTAAPESDPVPFVALENLGSRSGALLPGTELPHVAPDPAGMTSFQAGDVLFGKLRPYLAKSWRADRPGSCSTEFIVMRPRPPVDGRWLAYLAQSDFLVGWAVATSEGVKMPRTSWEKIRLLRIDVPTLEEQRAIADYLDAETARIDAVVARRSAMAHLLEGWEQRRLLDQIGDWRGTNTVSLRQLGTDLLTGPFGTQLSASEYVEGGIPVINPSHISDGRVAPDPQVTVPENVAVRLKRHRLVPGDIVLGRKGDVGRAAVIGSTEAGWICGSDSIAMRTDPRMILPQFLAQTLSVAYYREQLEARSTGATIANVNETILKAFRVPALDIREQAAIVELGAAIKCRRVEGVRLFEEQVGLLHERRQALITAAVTGELEIPGVAA